MIRLAPIKGAGLHPTFLESKVKVIENWIANVRRLKPSLVLPELDKVIPIWEKPRDGDRFKILRILFKSEEGLNTMFDLLHGSKADLVEGFPLELQEVREKIYLSLPRSRGREGNAGQKH